MKFKKYLREAVDMGNGRTATQVSIYMDDDDTLRIEPRGNLAAINIDVDRGDITRAFKGMAVRTEAVVDSSRGGTVPVKLGLEDDETFCITGIRPGRPYCIDASEEEFMSVLDMGRMLRNIPMWL